MYHVSHCRRSHLSAWVYCRSPLRSSPRPDPQSAPCPSLSTRSLATTPPQPHRHAQLCYDSYHHTPARPSSGLRWIKDGEKVRQSKKQGGRSGESGVNDNGSKRAGSDSWMWLVCLCQCCVFAVCCTCVLAGQTLRHDRSFTVCPVLADIQSTLMKGKKDKIYCNFKNIDNLI